MKQDVSQKMEDVKYQSAHIECKFLLITTQGAHTSSVSVYVRNIKKCMGES